MILPQNAFDLHIASIGSPASPRVFLDSQLYDFRARLSSFITSAAVSSRQRPHPVREFFSTSALAGRRSVTSHTGRFRLSAGGRRRASDARKRVYSTLTDNKT